MHRIVLIIVSLLAGQSLQNPVKRKDLLSAASDKIMLANEVEDVDSQLFEGDIELSPDDIESRRDHGRISKRNAQRTRQKLWISRVIPYEIDSQLEKESYVEHIKAAIEEFHQHSCIRWVRHTDQQKWIRFVKSYKCSSAVGKEYWSEGFQTISLSSGCKNKGTILHEMMHATGFWHEQSRPDRNKYVEIMWENIEAGKEDNFEKYDHQTIDNLGVQYDYKSIMHYGKQSFSSNGEPTIQAIGNPNMELGQREGLSNLDKIKLNALYDCKDINGGWSSWSSFTPCRQCKKYRQRYCIDRDRTNCPGVDYYGIQTEIVDCTPQECTAPVEGHWGRWSAWSICSATCGQGTHTRTRLCDDPTPTRGGRNCDGKSVDRQSCVMKDCNLGPDDCEFDAGVWCHWSQDETDSNPMDWERTSQPTPTFGTGPKGDHTSGSGYYIFAESSSPATNGDTTRLISKAFPPTSARCISFWYSMFGPAVGQLRVYVKDIRTNSRQKIWEKKGDQGESWMMGTADIVSYNEYEIIFEAVRGFSFQGDIALDDIIFKYGSCHGRKPVTGTLTSMPTTEALRPTEVLSTEAPSTEAPSTEAPSTEAPSTEAPSTEAPSTEAPSTEAPSTEAPSTEAPSTEAPSTEAPSTEAPSTEAPSTEAPSTEAPSTEAPSTEAPSTEAPSTEAPSKEVPSTNSPSSEDIDDFCDFGSTEHTFCTWKNDPSNSKTPEGYVFDWWWMKLPTPSQGTGPSADHTTGSGYYIYLESSNPFVSGNKARLLSRKYQSSSAVCLHFWYHMYGETIGSLAVYIDNENGRNKIWAKKGNQGNEWRDAYVPFKSESPFRIAIEGERGLGYTGDIGLDDIEVSSGPCSFNKR